ncbi:hypothetical protein QC758_08625 [Halomonas campisalis]|nr:hypothetical protein [Halomonas campisalis]MDR5863026.1 hypothetical protein [Halomonas campisalis]
MAEQSNKPYHDDSGLLSLVLGLVVTVGLACLPLVVGIVKVLGN